MSDFTKFIIIVAGFVVFVLVIYSVHSLVSDDGSTPYTNSVTKEVIGPQTTQLDRWVLTAERDNCWRVVTDGEKFLAQFRVYGDEDGWTELHYHEFDTAEKAWQLISHTRASYLAKIQKEWKPVVGGKP